MKKIIRLSDVLRLHKNNRNNQYMFIILRRQMDKYNKTPADILKLKLVVIDGKDTKN